jgi:predicted lipoprotein
MTADLSMLDVRLERLRELLRDASSEERIRLERAIKAVARARQALLQAHLNGMRARARLATAQATTRWETVETARLKPEAELQIIHDRSS